jgi:hypothetical protein
LASSSIHPSIHTNKYKQKRSLLISLKIVTIIASPRATHDPSPRSAREAPVAQARIAALAELAGLSSCCGSSESIHWSPKQESLMTLVGSDTRSVEVAVASGVEAVARETVGAASAAAAAVVAIAGPAASFAEGTVADLAAATVGLVGVYYSVDIDADIGDTLAAAGN